MSLLENASKFFSRACTFLSTIPNYFSFSASKDREQSPRNLSKSLIDSHSNSPDATLSQAETSVNVGEEGGLILSRSSSSSASTSTFELTPTSEFSSISSISSESESSINSSFSDFLRSYINKTSDKSNLPRKSDNQSSPSSRMGINRTGAKQELIILKANSRPNLPEGHGVGLGRTPAYTEVPSFPDTQAKPDEASKSLSNPQTLDLPAKIMQGRDTKGYRGLPNPEDPNKNQTNPVEKGVWRKSAFTPVPPTTQEIAIQIVDKARRDAGASRKVELTF